MIRSFRSKPLRRYVENGDRGKLSVVNLRRLDTMLEILDEAERPEDMDIPGWHLHALKGGMKGRYAVSVSGNWRLTFGWRETDVIDLDLEDFH